MRFKRGHSIVVSIFVVLATLYYCVYPLGFAEVKAETPWIDNTSSWPFRQKFTLTNPAASSLTDYQFLLDEALVGRWKMDDNAGTTVADSSGYGHNGTITGLGFGINWTTSGQYSNALSFSGSPTDYVSVGNFPVFNNNVNTITISAWARSSDTTSNMRIVSKGLDLGSWTKGYFLDFSAGNVRFGVGGGTQAGSILYNTTGTNFSDNNWHHIVSVIDSSSGIGKIFVDGTERNLSASAGTCGTVSDTTIDFSSCSALSLANSTYPLMIGRNDNAASQPWNGTLDEVRIFNRALSSTDISYLYNNNVSPILKSHLYTNSLDDGSDLRFTASDGITNIPYYIEQYDGSDQYARIWLKIPSIAASGTTTDIYCYYGNDSANPVSSITNTFSYADDFADSSLSSDWTITTGNGTISESGGDLDFSYSGTSTDWWSAPTGRQVKIIKYNTVPSYDFWAQAKLLNYTVNDRTHAGIGVYDSDAAAYIWGRQDGASNNDFSLAKIGGTGVSYASTTLPAWLGISKTGSSFSFWLSHDNRTWYRTGTSYSDITFRNVIFFGKSWLGNALNFSIDDFLIRQYSATPPAISSDGVPEEVPVAVDPTLVFTVEGVNSGETHNGVTTNVSTTFDHIAFGKLEMTVPKFAAHKLTVTTNSNTGYIVIVKMDGYIQGLFPANKIDPFGATNASWSTPQPWSTPNGTEKNTDSGWVGANTSDTRVAGWANASGKFGPISTTAHTVMSGADSESSATRYVSYAIETNQFQPSDVYSGTIVYNVIPTY